MNDAAMHHRPRPVTPWGRLLVFLMIASSYLPLAALDAAQASRPNPPLFYAGSPGVAEYRAAAEDELDSARAALESMLSVSGQRTIENTLVPFNDVVMHADNAANDAQLLEAAHPDSAYRAAAAEVTQQASKFLTDLSLNRDVYDALGALDLKSGDASTRRLVEKTLRDFRRAGVDKDAEVRRRVGALQEELVKIGQEFDREIADDARSVTLASASELEGLPEDYIRSHPPAADGTIRITIEYPDYYPIAQYARREDVRRRLYYERQNRAYPANMTVLDRLMAKRYELARVLGYRDWASYATEDKMIGSPKRAAGFLARLNGVTFRRASEENARYLKRKQQDQPDARVVNPWEISYYRGLIRKQEYDFDPQELRQYFPFQGVKSGVLDVTSRMFGVTYKRIEDATVWHPTVEAYEVWDGDDLLGRFFLDLHPRPNKFSHAAAFPLRAGVQGRQLPEAALVCNFPGQNPDEPGLMEHGQVVTFFHEFGHLIHWLFSGRARWESLSAFNVEWDFVEAPSQMLEEWCRDARVLRTFAKHYESGEPIPESLVERMNRADAFGRGTDIAYQAYFAAISLDLYDQDPKGIDTDAVVRDLAPKYLPFPLAPDTHMQTSFGHLNDYSALVYTYMWSLVIAKDLFSKFDRSNLLDPGIAGAYRAEVLAPGASKPALALVKGFLGRNYNFQAFDAWLGGAD